MLGMCQGGWGRGGEVHLEEQEEESLYLLCVKRGYDATCKRLNVMIAELKGQGDLY